MTLAIRLEAKYLLATFSTTLGSRGELAKRLAPYDDRAEQCQGYGLWNADCEILE